MQEYRTYTNGDQFWYQNNLLHRTDGPVVVRANGGQAWFFQDRGLSFNEWATRVGLTPGEKTFMLLKYG